MNLKDKTVVITGAGSGIGRATALAFAREGANIAACDVDQPRLDALAQELGPRALLVRKVDVASRAAFSAFADEVHALALAADVVVNNAGVAVGGPFLETSLDDWDWLLGINLRGVVHGCHFFVPQMVARKQGGQVVNIASILGIFPAPNVTAYVASKFAVLGMSQSLRAELDGTGVGVTAICPGLINTQIVADGRFRGRTEQRKGNLVGRFKKGLDPARVADVIVDAALSNPAVRTVGKDAWAMHQLTRVAPRALGKLGTVVARRFG
ncbi:MAG TPA: SDR family NAD(P)-dependent oxidoreductase [Kofleriaceae bacterium]